MEADDKTDEADALPVNGNTRKGHHKHHEGLPDDMLCGIGPFRTQCLQSCARMGSFVGAYSICGLMTSILSIYIVSQITTIEKQYGLSSSQSGFLLSCNDIGYLMTTLFASYFARKVHIPRCIWVTVVLYGVAGILCCLPYFISKDLVLEQAAQLTNIKTNNLNVPNFTMNSFTIDRKSPLCNLAKDTSVGTGYAVIVSNTSQCDVQGTSFGVGEPNKYTNVAITFIAIGNKILQVPIFKSRGESEKGLLYLYTIRPFSLSPFVFQVHVYIHAGRHTSNVTIWVMIKQIHEFT